MKGFKNLSIRAKISILTIPMIIALIAAITFSSVRIDATQKEVTGVYYDTLYKVNSALINADRDFYQSMLAATQYYDLSNGYGEPPVELKGKLLSQQMDSYKSNKDQTLENYNKAVDIAKTNGDIFHEYRAENGDTFEAAAKKFEESFAEWETLYDLEAKTGDWNKFCETFDAAREHLNTMQEITEAWADDENIALTQKNNTVVWTSGAVFVIIIAILIVLTTVISKELMSGIYAVTSNLDELAKGNLALKLPSDDEIGQDEIGMMQKSERALVGKLKDIISGTRDMAEQLSRSGADLSESASQASQASEQVTDAVNDISKGAVSQAESVESAAGDTNDIGNNIETIATNVIEMDRYTEEMKAACDTAMDALNNLIRQSEDVTLSVEGIGDSIVSTNESVKMISEFTQAITDIAAQTNLLSLNASIEAARAGEAGRGFAVVADEIRQLADQSGTSADKIRGIVDKLLANSEASVRELKKLNDSFAVQAKQLDSTKSDMEVMSSNVSNVSATSGNISGRVATLTDAKNGLTEIISDLSAISEENAASTEQTNASMEELNATFTIISDSASKLQRLAKELEDNISFFKL